MQGMFTLSIYNWVFYWSRLLIGFGMAFKVSDIIAPCVDLCSRLSMYNKRRRRRTFVGVPTHANEVCNFAMALTRALTIVGVCWCLYRVCLNGPSAICESLFKWTYHGSVEEGPKQRGVGRIP